MDKRLLLIFLAFIICTASIAQTKRKQKKIDKVIEQARAYIGTPYVYGGTSTSGLDCSGLIFNCYRAIDIRLPRTAEEQSKIGNTKSWGSIRPGDLVYFKFKEKRNKWYHSGLITAVNGDDIKFIHASSSRGVVESSLNTDYYKSNVKKFKRVIK
ncbi:C40 family peptidase [Marinoscillum sp. MHG1-6]|uniref:C40 family peptidase n=1 Tax=Marinoscillum sp. MHG1-6 TaxID=2959627 RepID=UPI0021583DAC|nr:C40 family peptidase [Marinoscillum sp. MHG1-6]